jgi:hypothetical protein
VSAGLAIVAVIVDEPPTIGPCTFESTGALGRPTAVTAALGFELSLARNQRCKATRAMYFVPAVSPVTITCIFLAVEPSVGLNGAVCTFKYTLAALMLDAVAKLSFSGDISTR